MNIVEEPQPQQEFSFVDWPQQPKFESTTIEDPQQQQQQQELTLVEDTQQQQQ